MCGIAGIMRVTFAQAGALAAARPLTDAIPEPWLDALDAGVMHRGPDGQGRFRDRAAHGGGAVVDVALVHRRLSILDLALGAQPMVAAPREGARGAPAARALVFHGLPCDPVRYEPCPAGPAPLAVVFNGCIYNHRELRRALSAAGHAFATNHSDTEVLLHGWRAWGDGLWGRLDSMIAAALWDGGRARLVLVRDRAGEKPLHWSARQTAEGLTFAFASCPAALADLARVTDVAGAPAAGAAVDPARLHPWMTFGFGADPPLTPQRSVAPGHRRAFAEAGDAGPAPYWTPPQARDRPLDAQRLDALLTAAVESRMEADVPVGCFLSGGVDSSLVAALAQRRLSQTGRRLRTFTLRMPDPRYDESAHARRAAEHLGTDHVTLECHPRPAEDLVALIEQLGLPLGDSSLLPTHWVARAARQHVSVALTGDGGDELFGGYDRYRAARILARHGAWLRRLPAGWLPRTDPTSRASRAARLVEAARHDGYADLLRIFPASLHADLGLTGARAGPGAEGAPIRDPLRWDFERYLPGVLCKVDTGAMAVALETRPPFLATDVLDAALAAPLHALMPGGRRKGLLRRVARRYLPGEILDRPKMGFAIPIGDWFRTDFGGLKTLLLDHLRSAEPFGSAGLGLDHARPLIDRLLGEHLEERRDHGQRLYHLLVLSIWGRWVARAEAHAPVNPPRPSYR